MSAPDGSDGPGTPGDGATPTRPVVLSVRDLHVSFPGEAGPVRAVRGLGFEVRAGESLAIVGESGSGKSATALALMGLHPPTARVEGSVRLLGEELVGRDDAALSRVRGASMAMVFQDPLSALTPVYPIGEQVAEAIRAHRDVPRGVAARRAVELLELVGIGDPGRRANAFPHELSGGMRQRATIAMAIANEPAVIVADEPTTALDVTVQAQVLDVLRAARHETGAALVLVTHDLGVVAGTADAVIVMYAGRAVERGSVDDVFDRPAMPYTVGLLGSVPRLDGDRERALAGIPGSPPAGDDALPGCPFAPRCPAAIEPCDAREPALAPTAGAGAHLAACLRSEELVAGTLERAALYPPPRVAPPASPDGSSSGPRSPVLELRGVKRHFPLYRGRLLRRRIGTVRAVDGVDLEILPGETLGLVGESGCGKSTTVLEILNLEPPGEGTVSVLGTDVASLHGRRGRAARKALRRDLQVVFQDPTGSLDPRMAVFDLIAEPLATFDVPRAERAARVHELLDRVGLEPGLAERYPAQLSGGQRQRVGIARALALEPRLVILDEPVSALDVSVQAGVLNLLAELKASLGIAWLFVAHDLAVVRHVADRVAVMYLGTIVETGDVRDVYGTPAHPYTRTLLSAVPVPDPRVERARRRTLPLGDAPSPADPPSGCRFHPRCPVRSTLDEAERRRCADEVPALVAVPARDATEGASHGAPHRARAAACHFPERPAASAGRRAP